MKKIHLVVSDTFTASALFIELLSKQYNAKKLSMGDFLRNERNNKTELSIEMNEFFDKGLVLPVDIQVKILRKALNHFDTSLILENYPRGGDSEIAFDKLISSGEIVIESIWHLNLVNIEFAIKKYFQENTYVVEKYETTTENVTSRIQKQKDSGAETISYLSKKYKIESIDIDFERIKDLNDFYKEIITKPNKA